MRATSEMMRRMRLSALPQYCTEPMMSVTTPPKERPEETIEEPTGRTPAISAMTPRTTYAMNALRACTSDAFENSSRQVYCGSQYPLGCGTMGADCIFSGTGLSVHWPPTATQASWLSYERTTWLVGQKVSYLGDGSTSE